ncbi:salt stress protein, Slr1339 family [Pantanalinema rosaneae CENA516]|uniref:salt stress protein, Slr1339 family n=1 Tax=Pantanalinema rosaneae TaxID=1620701 RepID=UPI003D702169
MDPLDRLLSDLEGKPPQAIPSSPPPAVVPPGNSPPAASGSVDDLLAQLEPKSNHHTDSTPRSPSSRPASSSPSALPPLPSPTQPPAHIARSQPAPPLQPKPLPLEPIERSSTDPLLAQLKADYAERDRLEAQQRQQQQREAQRQQEQLTRQRRAALAEQAKQWLAQLAPNSDEWLWFEEFSQRYPSKLEAAIDYLDAVYRQS